jgi:uncharacterized protein YerC
VTKNTTNAVEARKLKAIERRLAVRKMRNEGRTFAEIGKHFGIGQQMASNLYKASIFHKPDVAAQHPSANRQISHET